MKPGKIALDYSPGKGQATKKDFLSMSANRIQCRRSVQTNSSVYPKCAKGG